MPHLDAVMGTARSLQEAGLPFAVVTKADLATLDQLSRHPFAGCAGDVG